MEKVLIGPSLLASDLSNLASQSQLVIDCGADFLHLDVMDGHFVPNISFGAPVIKCLKANIPLHEFDVHLMVTSPHLWVNDMAEAGATFFTFHIEATVDEEHCVNLINQIKAKGMKVGIAVKPATSVETVFPFLEMIDLVLVMTVEPGFGGQKFMEDMMPKVALIRKLSPHILIEVDGGLDPVTTEIAVRNGASKIVAGSAVFKKDPRDAIAILREAADKH